MQDLIFYGLMRLPVPPHTLLTVVSVISQDSNLDTPTGVSL